MTGKPIVCGPLVGVDCAEACDATFTETTTQSLNLILSQTLTLTLTLTQP